jgi:predicted DNA-binding transcriptional regulator AlpA
MTEKNKGGRPLIVLTDEQRNELETLAAVLNVEQIADYFGISRRVFYDIMERDEEVSAQYKKGKAKAVGFVAQNLIQKARSGDLGAQIFYLKTQAGWKETQRLEGAGNDGEHVHAYKWLSDEDEDD